MNDRPGRLEAADGGTGLFDDVAELPPSIQTKVLRFVQDRSFERLGSNGTIKVRARIIAASNRDLAEETAAGRFREDLYYRLNVITLRLIPLRERSEDILPLAQWFLKQLSFKTERSQATISRRAAEALISYPWPGNIRELHNALEHAATIATTDTITFGDLPEPIKNPASCKSMRIARGTRLEDFERDHIVRVLAESPTLEKAADTLGINVTTLWRKRRHYGIA